MIHCSENVGRQEEGLARSLHTTGYSEVLGGEQVEVLVETAAGFDVEGNAGSHTAEGRMAP